MHKCRAYRNGDWIIYYCDKCNIERHQNWRTGEMKVFGFSEIQHYGSYVPKEYIESFENTN